MIKFTSLYLILSLVCLSWLFSCEEKTKTNSDEGNVESIQIYAQTLLKFPPLSNKSQELITDWPVFKDFKRISQNLSQIPIEDLRHRSNNLRLRADSLATTIPENLNSPIIASRLLVVSTRINLLNQEAKKINPDSVAVELKLIELYQSIREFVLHINDKLEKDRLDNEGVNKVSYIP